MKKQITEDNRGMTLVEIIVAIVILAIVLVPLLHAFVTGANTERKSRQYGEATTAAQNLIESIESMTMGQVLNGSSIDGSSPTFYKKDWQTEYDINSLVPDKKSAPGSRLYYMKLSDLSYSGSSTAYDARVTLSADDSSASSINSTGLIKSNAVDAAVNISGLDEQVFADLIAKNTGITVTDDKAKAMLSRNINIVVSGPTGSAKYAIEVTVTYHGENAVVELIPVTVTQPDGTETTEYVPGPPKDYDKTISMTTSCDAPAPTDNKEALFSLFVYMTGYYDRGDYSYDSINIENNTDSVNSKRYEFNVFLVDASTEAERAAALTTYADRTRIYYKNQIVHTEEVDPDDPSTTTSKMMKRVFTNLAGFATGTHYYIGGGWQKAITGALVETVVGDHFYDINVALYKQGADQTKEDPVLVMNSSQLD